MKRLLSIIAALALITSPVWAEIKTVTLLVPGMTCATCPITVKKALTKVEGVSKIEIRLDERLVVVTYDDEKTTVDALTKATTSAGYPSTVSK